MILYCPSQLQAALSPREPETAGRTVCHSRASRHGPSQPNPNALHHARAAEMVVPKHADYRQRLIGGFRPIRVEALILQS